MLPKIPSKIIENANGGKGHIILQPVTIPPGRFKRKMPSLCKGYIGKKAAPWVCTSTREMEKSTTSFPAMVSTLIMTLLTKSILVMPCSVRMETAMLWKISVMKTWCLWALLFTTIDMHTKSSAPKRCFFIARNQFFLSVVIH